jgi:hypothetical protein
MLERQTDGRIGGHRAGRSLEKLPKLIGRNGLAVVRMGQAIVEDGAERCRTQRAAEVACEKVGGGSAASLRPVDELLNENE